MPANPAPELTLPPYEQRLAERIIAEEDVQRVLAVDMPLRDQVLLQLLYTGGLRVSEACGLRWRNLRARGDAGQVTGAISFQLKVCGKPFRNTSGFDDLDVFASSTRFLQHPAHDPEQRVVAPPEAELHDSAARRANGGAKLSPTLATAGSLPRVRRESSSA